MAAIAVTLTSEVLQRYLAAFNRADWATYKSSLTPDSIDNEPGGMEMQEPHAAVEGVKVFRVAFPDLTGEVMRLMPGDAAAAAEIVWRGTHTGPLGTPTGTIPPTGKPVIVHVVGQHLRPCRDSSYGDRSVRIHLFSPIVAAGLIGATG